MKNKVSLFLAMICVFFSVVSKADIGVTNDGLHEISVQFIGEGASKFYTMPANSYGYHLVIPSSDFKWNCPDRYCILQVSATIITRLGPEEFPLVNVFTDLSGDTILNAEPVYGVIERPFSFIQNSENSFTISELPAGK